MSKTNCWSAKTCGREPKGVKAKELGICPAATATEFDGCNNGTNAGRACWAISGTICGGKIQGTFAKKELSCMNCEFFLQVRDEEGQFFDLKPEVVE